MRNRGNAARLVVLVDAVGCAATALAVIGWPAMLRHVDPGPDARPVLAPALLGTAGGTGSRLEDNGPSRQHLTSSVAINAVWTAACLAILPHRNTRLGVAIVGTTASLDAAGCLQWARRPRRRRERLYSYGTASPTTSGRRYRSPSSRGAVAVLDARRPLHPQN